MYLVFCGFLFCLALASANTFFFLFRPFLVFTLSRSSAFRVVGAFILSIAMRFRSYQHTHIQWSYQYTRFHTFLYVICTIQSSPTQNAIVQLRTGRFVWTWFTRIFFVSLFKLFTHTSYTIILLPKPHTFRSEIF